jgi:glycerate kinase
VHELRVLIIAQAFKETLTAGEVGAAVARGAAQSGANVRVLKSSDGGDGLLEALDQVLVRVTECVTDGPCGAAVHVPVGWLDADRAVIESRLVCGLSLLRQDERDPLRTTTRGLGTLILRLRDEGARHLYVGLGGSATVDGGLGMARAWGWVPRNAAGEELPEGGGALVDLAVLEAGQPPEVSLTGLCDVQNPLTGSRGARVYAPQKGASPDDVERLAQGLERLARMAEDMRGSSVATQPGAGAAGGLGFGILFFGGGRLVPGAHWVLHRVGFHEALADSDLVVTGEGSFDETSLEGKLTGEVIQHARQSRVPVILLAPRARAVPADVMLESGGGVWNDRDLEERAGRAIARYRRLLQR